MIPVVVFACLMVGVGWWLVKWLAARGAAEYRQRAEKLEQIALLPLQEAASRALLLLADTQRFRAPEGSAAGDRALQGLAPEIAKVFRQYEVIELVKGPHAAVGRSSIAPSALKPGFLRIGTVAGGTDAEGELSVRPDEETIFEFHPSEPPDATFGTYRSIYHWVLAMAAEAK
jgi:hypothetical protein